MSENQVTPEERRERMRQKELQNPSGSIHGSNLSDLVGGMGWKRTGILILAIVLGFIIYTAFFR
jgi:hypothetical protein